MPQTPDLDPWEQLDPDSLHEQELNELAKILEQAKQEEQRQKAQGKGADATPSGQTELIENISRGVIDRLQKEYKQPPADLAKHLVALQKVEMGFASFLVARIEAMESRIGQLDRERARLERLVQDSSRSILGTLFTGVRSQLKLDGIKAELRTLANEKKRVWDYKVNFNMARAGRKTDTRESAKALLIERRDKGLLHLQDITLELLAVCAVEGEAYLASTGKIPPQFLARGGAAMSHFGKFTSGLSQHLKALIDKASDPNSYMDPDIDFGPEMQRQIHVFMAGHECEQPNSYLSLAKVLTAKRPHSLIPETHAANLLSWEKQSERPKLEALAFLIRSLSDDSRERVGKIIRLFKRIEHLNRIEPGSPDRLALVHLFRELLIRQANLVQNLKKSSKGTAIQKRRLHETVHHGLDRAVLFLVDHWDEI